MRRLYLAPEEFVATEVRLTGARARRLTGVLRLRPGATLRVFDGRGAERMALVLRSGRAVTALELGEVVAPLPEPRVAVTLVCAFPRGARGDWIVEKTTELGVARIVPLRSDRAVLAPGRGRLARWRRVAIEAAEQCGRAVVPEFGGEPPPGALELVADREQGVYVREALDGAARTTAVALFVGPEGGWSDREREEHAAAGRVTVTLGPRTLRVETAAVVGVAQVLEATGGLERV
jgi:16S rRNA (uracil1498-N3)-methyltransferase